MSPLHLFTSSSRLLAATMALALDLTQLCHAGTAPANDECSTARTVSLGANPFTTIGANVAAPGVSCAGSIIADVWFKFTSTFTGDLTVSTCDDADFDTVIAVYSGCSCSTFTALGCNDESASCPDHTSTLTVAVQAGSCYRIRVAGFAGGGGGPSSGTGVMTLIVADPQNAAGAARIRSGFDPEDRFGISVAGGKINGDVPRDVLIGAYLNNTIGIDAGRAYAYQGADLSALYTKTGAAAGDQLGFSVALTDANDDGRADLVIGAPLADSNGVNAGYVYVYSGFDGALLWKKKGYAAGDRLGYSVAAAGDYNNDGYDDVLVGAPYNDVGGVNAGRAYVLSGASGILLRAATGQSAGELFGYAVAGIGDVNNDGKDDYAVGAPKNDVGGTDAGRVSILAGGTGTALMRINGDAAGDQFGSAVAGKRFVSGSTYELLAIGAPFNNAAGTDAGRVKVYLRNITTPSASGCASFLCLRYTMNGGNPGDRFGTAVAIGDLVGTSFADIVVGAPLADLNGTSSGAVYVFNGASGSLTKRFYGEAAGDQFGKSLAIAGDVSGDGDNDLIVGAPYNDANGSNAGRAYVFFVDDSADQGGGFAGAGGPDINRDGAVNGDDVLAVLAAWGPCAAAPMPRECPADLDLNGDVNVDDLLAVIAAWRP